MPRVLIFGGRDWVETFPITVLLDGLLARRPDDLIVISGMARGADMIAADWAKANGLTKQNGRLMPFPVLDEDRRLYGRVGPHMRNQRMLDEGKPVRAWGFKNNYDWSLTKGGTEDMSRRLKKACIPYYIVGAGLPPANKE